MRGVLDWASALYRRLTESFWSSRTTECTVAVLPVPGTPWISVPHLVSELLKTSRLTAVLTEASSGTRKNVFSDKARDLVALLLATGQELGSRRHMEQCLCTLGWRQCHQVRVGFKESGGKSTEVSIASISVRQTSAIFQTKTAPMHSLGHSVIPDSDLASVLARLPRNRTTASPACICESGPNTPSRCASIGRSAS